MLKNHICELEHGKLSLDRILKFTYFTMSVVKYSNRFCEVVILFISVDA